MGAWAYSCGPWHAIRTHNTHQAKLAIIWTQPDGCYLATLHGYSVGGKLRRENCRAFQLDDCSVEKIVEGNDSDNVPITQEVGVGVLPDQGPELHDGDKAAKVGNLGLWVLPVSDTREVEQLRTLLFNKSIKHAMISNCSVVIHLLIHLLHGKAPPRRTPRKHPIPHSSSPPVACNASKQSPQHAIHITHTCSIYLVDFSPKAVLEFFLHPPLSFGAFKQVEVRQNPHHLWETVCLAEE